MGEKKSFKITEKIQCLKMLDLGLSQDSGWIFSWLQFSSQQIRRFLIKGRFLWKVQGKWVLRPLLIM